MNRIKITQNQFCFLSCVAAGALTLLILASPIQAKPDLIVSKIVLTRDSGGIFVDKVSVTVANGCVDAAGSSHLQITFKETADSSSKPLYYLVSPLRSMRGGDRQTLTFHVLEKKIVYGRHLSVEVDSFRKVDEASEENNWSTVFPEKTNQIGRC